MRKLAAFLLGLLLLTVPAFGEEPCCGGYVGIGGGGGGGLDPGSPPAVASGCYTGNATDDRLITTGFEPDVVILTEIDVGTANDSFWRTSAMSGDFSCAWETSATGCPANRIQSFEAMGFVVGTDNDVNGSGEDYCWVAWACTPNFCEVGTYTGDNEVTQTVTTGFVPDGLMMVQRTFTGGSGQYVKTIGMPDGAAVDWSRSVGEGLRTDYITAFTIGDPPSFTVGNGASSSGETNQSPIVYDYVAFNKVEKQWFDEGVYQGSGELSITIETICDEIDWVWVTEGANGALTCKVWRSIDMVDAINDIDARWAATSDVPQAQEGLGDLDGNTGSFVVHDGNGAGTWDCTAADNSPYYWFALCSNP